jgi:hypothetical protein
VVTLDPAGETDAFRELARPWYRLMLRGDRVGAGSLGPLVFADVAGTPALANPETQDMLRHTLDSTIPWPINGIVQEMEDRLRVASVYASFVQDPEQARLELALHRVAVLRRCEGHPWAMAESDAAIAVVQASLSADDERRLSAELRHALTDAIANGSTPHVVQEFMLLAARCEHALGTRSPLTVNAYWNLCMNAASLGDIEGSYDAFARFLWPEMSRQIHADGLRRWYLAYFAPVAFLACDYETAYAAGMQVLLDDLWLHGSPLHDGVADNAARAAAAALARWGDEAGARDIESAYGVTRIPPLAP